MQLYNLFMTVFDVILDKNMQLAYGFSDKVFFFFFKLKVFELNQKPRILLRIAVSMTNENNN